MVNLQPSHMEVPVDLSLLYEFANGPFPYKVTDPMDIAKLRDYKAAHYIIAVIPEESASRTGYGDADPALVVALLAEGYAALKNHAPS